VLAEPLKWPVRHGLYDTSFVWLQYARHLAEGRGLVFNIGERVYAAVNPLWLGLLADAMAVNIDGLVFAKVVGAISTLVSVALFLQLMRRTVRTPIVRAVATVGWASQAWMAQYSMSGLETSFAVALTLAGFVALTEASEWGERPVRTGALWALAALARPGAALMLLLYATALLVDAQSRPGLRRLVFGLLPAAAIYGTWLLFTRLYFGTVWPHVLALQPASNPTLGVWWTRFYSEIATLARTEGLLVLVGVFAFVLTRRVPRLRSSAPALRLLPFAWVVALPALFAARGLGVSPRHLLLAVPVIHWLSWQAVDRWWSQDGRSATGWKPAVLSLILGTAVVVQNLIVHQTIVVPEVRARTADMQQGLIKWGRWFKRAPDGTTVASFAPGAIAYYGNLRVVDLSGLLSPGMVEARDGLPDSSVVAELAFEPVVRADYVVNRGVPVVRLLARTPFPAAFEPIDTHGEYSLMRMHWDRVTRPATPH
jgi:hypothetical protein